ncbi:MAG: hypothetical protein K8R88_14405 [Armatimonadetes bacterium]|nr:hypothetical protein [Armatimonadota bacterium]
MNTIKSLVIALVFVHTGICGAVIAQHHSPVQDHSAAVAKHLNLSPTQEKQLKELHLKAEKRLKAIEADSKLDKKGKDSAKEKLHKEMMGQAKKFLTADQLQQLSRMHANGQAEMHLRGMLKELGLDEGQKAAVEALVTSTKAQMEAIQKDNTLTDSQKADQASALHSATIHKVYDLLNPEQKAAFAKMMHGPTPK